MANTITKTWKNIFIILRPNSYISYMSFYSHPPKPIAWYCFEPNFFSKNKSLAASYP